MPAQPVDATPSSQLIRHYFPCRIDLFGCTRSKPSQGSVPADLNQRAILAFVFNARWVRAECCVDPLRPPRLSGVRLDWELRAGPRRPIFLGKAIWGTVMRLRGVFVLAAGLPFWTYIVENLTRKSDSLLQLTGHGRLEPLAFPELVDVCLE